MAGMFQTLLHSDISLIQVAFTVAVLYLSGKCFYNLYLHPLAQYPGPTLWRITRLAYMRSLWSGWLHHDVRNIHDRYGDIVRIAPNELSFARPDAWYDIYSNHGQQPAFPKSALWHGRQPGRAMSILNALDPHDHSRFRRALDPGFTERAVAQQEPIIQSYVDLFISKIRQHVGSMHSSPQHRNPASGAVINVVQWFNFVTFDLIGDLGFGESFDCLNSSTYHPWMTLIFNSLRAATLSASLHHYPLLHRALNLIIPASVQKKAAEHRNLVVDKVTRRLNKVDGNDRPDIISLTLKRHGPSNEGLSVDEIQATAGVIIVAGSETTVTMLSGVTNRLIRDPKALQKLTQEMRDTFKTKEDMSLRALRELPYLNAVLMEGLRMCNPTPVGLPRITPPQGGTVSGHYIPPNTFVNVHPLTLSFSSKHFHSPYSFSPERWLPSVKADPSSPFYADERDCIQPFGIGPRSCIGKPLAWAEMRLILARLVWAFDLFPADTPAGKLDWEEQRTFTVVEKKPFDVRVIPH